MTSTSSKPLLLVFIHGFLGSEASFCAFPDHLQDALQTELKSPVTIIHYPKYSTRGDNRLQVKQLVDWLLLNATTIDYSQVILCAHSMGGLLAADAYREIYSLKPSAQSNPVYLAWTGLTALMTSVSLSQTNTTKSKAPNNIKPSSGEIDPAEPTVRELINIVGILTFDSPFYGLNTALSWTGINKAKSISTLSTILNDQKPTSSKPMNDTANQGFASLSKTIPMAIGIGSQLMAAGSILATATTLTSSMAVWAAEEARSHLEFLYPLSESLSAMDDRVLSVYQDSNVHFRGMFLSIPKIVPTDDTEIIRHQQQKDTKNNENVNLSSSNECRTFCMLPSNASNIKLDWYSTVSSSYSDEIDAHMYLFHQDNGSEYDRLLNWTIENILIALMKQK